MGQPKHFLPPPRNVYFSHTGVGGKLKPFFTIDLKNFDLGSICLHKPFLKAASIIWPASNQGCAPQRSRAYSSGGAWDTLSRDCRGLAPVWATEEPNPIPNESGNTTAQLPNSQKKRFSSFSFCCWAVGQLCCQTHYEWGLARLWPRETPNSRSPWRRCPTPRPEACAQRALLTPRILFSSN